VCPQKVTAALLLKRLLPLIFAADLIGCAEQPPSPAATTGYLYNRYSTTAEVYGYYNTFYTGPLPSFRGVTLFRLLAAFHDHPATTME
jgi:hypothetical protein